MQSLPSNYDQLHLVRRIADAINELVERYGAEHPLLDTLVQKRLMDLLEGDDQQRVA